MGNEVKGALRAGKQRHEGKVLLETKEIIFRGPDYRLKIAFDEIRGVAAANGELRVQTKEGVKIFEVGPSAEKWREKILCPKTRAQKLGVRTGTLVRLVGEFDVDFVKELKVGKAEIVQANGSGVFENTFFAVDARNSLAALTKYAKKMKGAEALWVVYPKGKKEITENDVLSTGRKAGLKDIKVVSFSSTHTALKFVLPVEKR
jgi:hypothetical protein